MIRLPRIFLNNLGLFKDERVKDKVSSNNRLLSLQLLLSRRQIFFVRFEILRVLLTNGNVIARGGISAGATSKGGIP